VPYLSSRTDLVSLTIGGNDAGFADTVISCTLGSESACTAKVNEARSYITGTLPGALDRTYRAIRQKAPNAQVVVLGYPRLFDTSSAGCGIGGMSLAKRRAINAGADVLAGVIRGRAEAAGFTFADVRDRFDGHGACASSPWINGLTILPPTDSFHPNTAGYTNGYLPAMAAAVN
jgi:lysophospholipase L1-like esterase